MKLQDYNSELDGSSEMPFGKHEGESLLWIVLNDQSYAYWLVEQEWFQDDFDDLCSEFNELLEDCT